MIVSKCQPIIGIWYRFVVQHDLFYPVCDFFPVIYVSFMYNRLIFKCVTGRALVLPRSFVCKGDDKKLSLLNWVPLTALVYISRVWDKKHFLPRLWEHPRYRVIVAVGDLGSSLSARIFPDSPSWTKTHRILLAKDNRAGRCRCHSEIGFPLRKKQSTPCPERLSKSVPDF